MKKQTPNLATTEDFQLLLELLSQFSKATNDLANLQAVTNDHMLQVLEDVKPRYAELQEILTLAEAQMELIARRNLPWFTGKKTIKTPFGEISFRTSTELDIANEEAVLARLERESYARFPGRTAAPQTFMELSTAVPIDETPEGKRADFLAKYTRVKVALNLEALEAEDNAFLKTIGIARVLKENFKAKPKVLDLGKAIKESVGTPSAASHEKEAA